MKLARTLTNLVAYPVIVVLLLLWLVPAGCAWLEERVLSPALGWCFTTVGKSVHLAGLLLVVPAAGLLLLAAIAWLVGRLADPLQVAIEKLNHG